jgi:hypothetical protein
MHRLPTLSGKEVRVLDRSTTSQALESPHIFSLPALATSTTSLFGTPMSKLVTPLLCWGSDLPVGGSVFLSPRVSPFPLLLLPRLRLWLLRCPPQWPGVVVWHLGSLSLPPSISCNLGQPPGIVTLLPSTTPLAATPMSRTTSSMHAGLESLQLPPAPTVVTGSPSSSSTPTVPSVQMGSPSSIDSPRDLMPMQVDAVLLYHPNPLTSCTFGKRRLLGLFKMSTTASFHQV